MNKRMLVNAAQAGEVRVAVVENNILEDLNVAIEGNKQIKGNIYKAKVVSVESGLQAAFVDYGADRNGFITFNDIDERYYNKKYKGKGRPRIQDVLTNGAEMLVQVYKEEVGKKGAALTSDITMPGRYIVYMPYSGNGGVSRKIQDEETRKKLKELIAKLQIPEEVGIIVRTAGQGRTKTALQKDYQELARTWGHTLARYQQRKQPGLVYQEPDVVIRSVRDYFTDDVEEILVDNDEVLDRLVEFFERHSKDLVDRVKRYNGKMPIFSNFGLERQLEDIASHKVPLPSGGSIVINPTEALTAVDVNSGKSKGQNTQEEMAYQTNLEAAEMAARQLRLRDAGGLIVIDFIDMMDTKHRRGVERCLKQAMKRDKARIEIGRISRFGLLEMSRQRIKARLLSSTHVTCPMCEGSGFVMTADVSAMTMLRRLQELAVSAPKAARIRGRLPVNVALKLLNEHRTAISGLEENFEVQIEIIPEIGAVSARDAFEIVTGSERSKDENNDRKDRRDRGRDRKERGRGRRGKSQSNHKNQKVESDPDSLPYEPPKVVGFIEPDQLATAELGPETIDFDDDAPLSDPPEILDGEAGEEKAAEGSNEEEPRRRRRRRRGRGRGRGRSDGEQQTQNEDRNEDRAETRSTEENQSNEDDGEASKRRAAARERNRARRAKRMGESGNTSSEEREARTEKTEKTEKPKRTRRGGRKAKSSQGEADQAQTTHTEAVAPESSAEVAKASHKAAGRVRDRLKAKAAKQEEVVAPKKTEAKKAAKADPKKAKADAKKAKPKTSALSRIANRLKEKLSGNKSAEPEVQAEESQSAQDAKTPEASEAKTRSASRSAAARLKARRAQAAQAEAPAAQKADETAEEKPKRARRTTKKAAAPAKKSAAAAKKADEAAEEKPKRARRTTKKADETAEAKPKRTRRTTKKAEEAPATDKPAQKRASSRLKSKLRKAAPTDPATPQEAAASVFATFGDENA